MDLEIQRLRRLLTEGGFDPAEAACALLGGAKRSQVFQLRLPDGTYWSRGNAFSGLRGHKKGGREYRLKYHLTSAMKLVSSTWRPDLFNGCTIVARDVLTGPEREVEVVRSSLGGAQ